MYLSLVIGSSLSVLLCVIGDQICSLPVLQTRRGDAVRAVVDNLTHGIVGGISWWLLIGFKYPKTSLFNTSRINQSLFCIFLSSVIDIDHFIAAGSINIEDVTRLPRRPPLHCSGLCFLITLGVWFLTRYYPGMILLPWEWLLSFMSHHVRDATRRGLWLIPWLLTTKPLPYYLYLAIIAAMPPLLSVILPISDPYFITYNETFVL